MPKVKDWENLESSERGEWVVTCQGIYKLNSWLLIRNNRGQNSSGITYNLLRGKNCQPRILYPSKISFKNEGKDFPRYIKIEVVAISSFL